MDQARTVIVNGIDRCGYRKARTVLTIITDALEVFDLPLRFIISSNRDTRIQDVFNLPSLSKVSRQFFVGVQPSEYFLKAKDSDPADILQRGFDALLRRHSGILRSKQSSNVEAMDTLIERSHGNGVYANTVINFLMLPEKPQEHSMKNLKLVLEPTPIFQKQGLTASFTDLDTLFTRILSTHPNPDSLVHALGILLVLHDCAQPQAILQNLFAMSTESFNSVLQVLESLMHFPKVENDQNIHPWRAVKRIYPTKTRG
ncbi:hypothetical protein CPB84DRAFT_993764 [Gymnopilus junonius]|uniref:Uncharacterized protein n=1 Tax=Gymnopilus junonius TaxID=109634 RepID=A0A9P5NQW8_GYMJU|nr:hypothetical protein CPB84DRAFT_993764 [Gymnopilus junonius]